MISIWISFSSILDSTTNKGVANLIHTISSVLPDAYSMWIGLSRPTKGSAWEWVDKSPLKYEAWSQESPSGDGDCVEIITEQNGAPDHSWNDLDRNVHRRAYVYKKPVNA